MKRCFIVVAITLVLIALGVGLWQWGRPRPTDEQRLYKLVTSGQEAVENHDPSALTRLLSRDYHDRLGNDKKQLTGMILGWLRGGPPLQVIPQIAGLKVEGKVADMQLKVRYWMGDTSGPGEEFGMAVRLQKERGEWKVISAEGWQEQQGKLLDWQ